MQRQLQNTIIGSPHPAYLQSSIFYRVNLRRLEAKKHNSSHHYKNQVNLKCSLCTTFIYKNSKVIFFTTLLTLFSELESALLEKNSKL